MPGRSYGPRTDIVISEEAAKQLEFLTMIARVQKDDQSFAENDVVEELIALHYNKTRAAFNKAMEVLNKE